jgi:hypothetical protein
MGHWEQQSPTLWVYCLEDRALLYGYVACQRSDEPTGAAWDAFVASERGGADTLVRAGVAREEAMRAVEQHALARRRSPPRRHSTATALSGQPVSSEFAWRGFQRASVTPLHIESLAGKGQRLQNLMGTRRPPTYHRGASGR